MHVFQGLHGEAESNIRGLAGSKERGLLIEVKHRRPGIG